MQLTYVRSRLTGFLDVGGRGRALDIEPDRESVRVAPVGELDIATVDKLQAEVSQLLETGFAKIVLDLRGVRFLDSTGLRLVLELDAADPEA